MSFAVHCQAGSLYSLPRRADKFCPKGFDQPVGLQSGRQSLGLDWSPCSFMLLHHEPWWCRKRQRCREEQCYAPVLPLHIPLSVSCVWHGTSGHLLCLAQVVNEVPDYCVLRADVQQAENSSHLLSSSHRLPAMGKQSGVFQRRLVLKAPWEAT